MFIRSILNFIRIIRSHRYLYSLFRQDMQNYIDYSCINSSNPECLATKMRLLTHAIEKGMSLPHCRKGFGKEKILQLVELCKNYQAIPSHKDPQVIELVHAVIKSYIELESKEGVDLSFIPQDVQEKVAQSKLYAGTLRLVGKIDPKLFEQVAKHRHSLRYFSTIPVSEHDIRSAVALAQTAPSACNRQPIHIYAVTDPDKIRQIVRLHGGIRTLSNPTVIFVVTGDRGLYCGEYERNTVFVDGGIFTMNLLYALDSLGIASCPAIWGNIPGDDARMNEIAGINRSHTIVNLIVGGYYPEAEYKVAASAKRSVEDILHVL